MVDRIREAELVRYLWSDLHIGHVRLAETWRTWAGGTVAEHNEYLATAWRSKVTDDDEIWIIGDACMGTLTDSLAFIADLPGDKHLVPGNHDRVSVTYLAENRAKASKADQWRAMYEAVFTIEPELVVPDWTELPDVILCHYPWSDYTDPGRVDDRPLIAEYGPSRDAWPDRFIVVHGHTHSQQKVTGDRLLHVGVDAWPDGPVAAERLAAVTA